MGEKNKKNENKEKKLVAINKAIKTKNLRWKAEETIMSKLSEEEVKKRLGSIIPEERIKLIEERREKKEKKGVAAGERLPKASLPKWDWRNVSGVNWVTAPKDQGNCGSCVSFAVVGVLEMMLRRWIYDDPAAKVNLSEAHLFYCNNRQCNVNDPNFGWNIAPGLDYVKNNGVPDEACFPYTGQNQPCNTCSNWENRIDHTKITHWKKITDKDEMKEMLRGHGCLAADFLVYEDFMSYPGGVYEYATGKKLGGHAIMVVGYDDNDGCWICKNSWFGTAWGESGFFRIGYDEVGIDDAMYSVDFVDTLMEADGKITFLRVHDVGTGYGPSIDFIDGEVVAKLDSKPDKAFGFQLRTDSNESERQGMLNLLRDCFNSGTRVRIEYFVTGMTTGRILRVVKIREVKNVVT
jgi:C1A family cysteine protease